MPKIQIKRGNRVNLPILDSGEPAFTTDTNQLFIGNGKQNIEIAKISDLNSYSSNTYLTASGTGTEIILSLNTLIDKYSFTFIAIEDNNSLATTINGIPLYKPNSKISPNITSGKAYTIWYDLSQLCFFIKASAEGNTVSSHVLAGETFSNDSDIGIIGSMTNQISQQVTQIITLINLLPSGNMENSGMTLTSNSAYSTTYKKYNNYSLSITCPTGSNESTVQTSDKITTTSGHIYYLSCWTYTTVTAAMQMYARIAEPSITISLSNLNTWSFCSGTLTFTSTSTDYCRLDNNTTGSTIYYDGFSIIDLTTAYGAGKEPTKSQMDILMLNIGGWFSGTTLVESIPNGAYISNGTSGNPEILMNDQNLISSNIKSGSTICGINGKSSVVDTSDATATNSTILSSSTAYVNGTKITGSITSKAAATYNPSTSVQTITAGQYLSGTQTIAAITGTATDTDVASGKTYNSAAGILRTGTMPSKGAVTYTPGTSNQTIAAGQYLSGAQTILGDSNLTKYNIVAGSSIFGIAGQGDTTYITSVTTGGASTVTMTLSYNLYVAIFTVYNSSYSPLGAYFYFNGVLGNDGQNFYRANGSTTIIANRISISGLNFTFSGVPTTGYIIECIGATDI